MKKLIFISSVQKELAAERRALKNYIQGDVGVSKRTAHRELVDLVLKGVIERVGTTGKGTVYVLGKGASKGPKVPSPTEEVGSEMDQSAYTTPQRRKRNPDANGANKTSGRDRKTRGRGK